MNDTCLFFSGGHSNYRIPTIVSTNCGTIMAFVNDRRDTLSDHSQESWLVMRRKKSGKDWEELTVLAQHDGWSCRIESAVYDRLTDQTFLFFTRLPVSINEFGDYTEEDAVSLQAFLDRRIVPACSGKRKNAPPVQALPPVRL